MGGVEEEAAAAGVVEFGIVVVRHIAEQNHRSGRTDVSNVRHSWWYASWHAPSQSRI